ncbi:hypothetical protein J3Q64DRAFT_1774015 [Phycomyces blakesleeanus]|uniref:Uncharacterized protein n=2 Tax=Phycomyces blakesleeanus TaxID=4837 RepID=A0A167Q311_PHYB8|nr:hypothetical protein PHYBLDRAFT_141034 [Phycomyces blakesleeanus NRRL 1555(-)]OAD78977.1 hypothetical protein PHYBLDRAFT_141034 [Phycomyces blakesleeanus NRRL 1555(-)]|eukprot:XP_018297017.1 hypothetical protein PHYBLDRAFT_141034 [Phycomyces blakesleeanus NRRL 1555(-)]
MPGPGTLFTLGAVGVAGATMYARRNSGTEQNSSTRGPAPPQLSSLTSSSTTGPSARAVRAERKAAGPSSATTTTAFNLKSGLKTGEATINGAAATAGTRAAARAEARAAQLADDSSEWEGQISPHVMARRGSRGTSNDLWDSDKQAEHHWRRDYGINFGHNSHPKFPFNHSQK